MATVKKANLYRTAEGTIATFVQTDQDGAILLRAGNGEITAHPRDSVKQVNPYTVRLRIPGTSGPRQAGEYLAFASDGLAVGMLVRRKLEDGTFRELVVEAVDTKARGATKWLDAQIIPTTQTTMP